MHLPDWAYWIITGYRRCYARDEMGDRCLLHLGHGEVHQNAAGYWTLSRGGAE